MTKEELKDFLRKNLRVQVNVNKEYGYGYTERLQVSVKLYFEETDDQSYGYSGDVIFEDSDSVDISPPNCDNSY